LVSIVGYKFAIESCLGRRNRPAAPVSAVIGYKIALSISLVEMARKIRRSGKIRRFCLAAEYLRR
jgi:hypothetical protein